mmetsp:Transcript_38122/g.92729  ORF Transcript_38122/g.92729 Transcript_38122/m.92729 type:complete len:799 (-) Transcript_38122:70-2466(-)
MTLPLSRHRAKSNSLFQRRCCGALTIHSAFVASFSVWIVTSSLLFLRSSFQAMDYREAEEGSYHDCRLVASSSNHPPWEINVEADQVADGQSHQSPHPCDSALSLANYLKLVASENTTHAKHNPVCPDAARNHMHVVIPFYNLDKATLRAAVDSARNQTYPSNKYTIWLYDDASDGEGAEETLHEVCGSKRGVSNVFSFPLSRSESNWLYALQQVDSLNLPDIFGSDDGMSTDEPRTICFRATTHLGPGGGKYWAFGLIKSVAKPNDVILVLDGDDTLYPRALEVINQKYLEMSAWFTYGSYVGNWSEQMVDIPPEVRQGRVNFTPRKSKWLYGHPRSFKAHLLDHIGINDFLYSDDSWLMKGSERGFIYRMLELAGPDHIGYVSEKIYKYNFSRTKSTLASVNLSYRNASIEHTMIGMPQSSPLRAPLHVVLVVWRRLLLLPHQLKWIQQQESVGRPIHVHIVNNNYIGSLEVDNAVAKFRSWQAKKCQMCTPIMVSVQHKNGKLQNNFVRFVYTQQLRETKQLDEVIFVDDDQYWPPTFFATLLQSHKPKSMTTWYGKTFLRNNSTSLGSYWNPEYGLHDVMLGKGWTVYKYGGTGGSIFDSNLWLLDSQLLRLSSDLSEWSKIDDLWASYVLDALLGWSIRRLSPEVIPVDIGDYRNLPLYRQILLPQMDNATNFFLLSDKLVPPAHDLTEVATYKDPKVDKNEMFLKLQTDFLWDAVTHDGTPFEDFRREIGDLLPGKQFGPDRECPEGEKLYFSMYQDVRIALEDSRKTAFSHWKSHGQKEGRIYACDGRKEL